MELKLVEGWRRAYKWFSVQAMATATTLQVTWLSLPAELKATLHPQAVQWFTIALLVFGIGGRLFNQPSVDTPPAPSTSDKPPEPPSA